VIEKEKDMQLKDQAKKSRDWKTVAALTTLSALGVSGLALADSGDPTVPDSIDLKDRTEIAQLATPTTPGGDFPAIAFSADSANDSPFDDIASVASASVDSPASPTSVESPAESPASVESPAESPAGVESPAESPASVESPASAASEDSTDNSADS
jgi:hypothetical protein